MTESEWLSCANLDRMLRVVRFRASGRKCRLFACACVRAVLHLHQDERLRNALAVAERFADGDADARELQEARAAARAAAQSAAQDAAWAVAWAASWAASRDASWDESRDASRDAAWAASRDAADAAHAASRDAAWAAMKAVQCDLLRDICGNPFRRIAADPSWLTPTVVRLARGIYEYRAFDGMPALADAMEEAYCQDEAILAHCRGSKPHARGCWVLDMFLGKDYQ